MTVATNESVSPAPVQLDVIVQLLAQEEEAARAAEAWKKRREQLRDAIATFMGDAEEGKVGDEVVVTYEYVDQFREGEFKKQYPEIWKVYQREDIRMVLDKDLLRRAQPTTYREFQTRRLVNRYRKQEESTQ